MGSYSLNGNYFINLQRGYQLKVDFRERSFELNLDEDRYSRNLAGEAYTEILGRPGDSAGMQQWTRAIKSDLSERDLAKIFFTAPEYVTKNLSPEETVKKIYDFILDRKGDPEGVKIWADRVRGGQSISSVIDGFYDSPEFKEKETNELQNVQNTALNMIQLINRYLGFS